MLICLYSDFQFSLILEWTLLKKTYSPTIEHSVPNRNIILHEIRIGWGTWVARTVKFLTRSQLRVMSSGFTLGPVPSVEPTLKKKKEKK